MSQVYSVSLIGLKFKDERGVKEALHRKIASDTENNRANYSLGHYFGELGLDPENACHLLRMIFGGWDARLDHINWEGREWLTCGFNASYGWESIMMEAFEDIAPYLQDGVELNIDVDEGVDHAIVKDGRAVWTS